MMRWKDMLAGAVMTLCCALAQAELVYVGTQGRQLNVMRFDAVSGKLSMIGPVAEGLRPTWTVAHPRLPVLYAVNDENTKEGSVTAFAVNRETGALTRVNEVSTGGNGTTYLWFDAPSLTLLAANFAGGSASSMAVNRDGSVGALVSTIKATGSGPHRRQSGPHAHSVAIDPSGRYALVPDLGADRVFVYGFNRATRALSPDDANAPRSFTAPAGSGPRHLAFGADGRYVYVLNELTAEILTLRWDAQQGRLTQVQTMPTSSPGFAGTRSGAEVAVSGDGRFVYVEDRGEATLVVYGVNPASGELTLLQRLPTGGETPWGFALHPSGKWLLVAHQRSGKINVFRVDPTSGKVADTGQSIETPTPVSVTFIK
jgi:6-phosphogluconolactonase